jgi:hypothetical protein
MIYMLFLLFFFLLVGFIILPFGFLGLAITSLIDAPAQLYYMLAHPEVRKNHALEHATIHVLEESLSLQLSGMSYPNGFMVQGVGDPILVLQAAQVAKQRLLNGERDLAVHPRCGTTTVVTSFVFAIFFIIFSIIFGLFSWINLLLSLLLASILGRLLSPWVQRYITTDWRVQDIQILSAEPIIRGLFSRGVFVHTEKSDVKWSIR